MRKYAAATAGILFVLVSICCAPFAQFRDADKHKTAQEKLDFIDANRPYLEPTLHIDAVDSNWMTIYHYEIQNIGKLPASSIEEEQDSPDFKAPEFEIHNRFLAPNGKMSLLSRPVETTNGFFIKLFLRYNAEYQGTNKSYNSYLTFNVPLPTLKVGEFHYEEGLPELKQSPVHGTNANIVSFLHNKIDDPTGGFDGWFKVTNSGATAVNLVIGSNRLFLFEGKSKSVIFKSTYSNGKTVVLFKNFEENKENRHYIAVQWTTNGAFLCVDTNVVSDSFP